MPGPAPSAERPVAPADTEAVGPRADANTEISKHLGRLAAQTFTRAAATLQDTLQPGVAVVALLSGRWGGEPHLVALTSSERVVLIARSGPQAADLPSASTEAEAAGATLTLSSDGRVFQIEGVVSSALAKSFAAHFAPRTGA